MAQSKQFGIDFPGASLPLSGAETLSVIQSGSMVDVSAQDIADLGSGGGFPPVVTNSATSLAATSANAGNYTRFTNASAKTYTFDSAQSYNVGDEYHGRNVGAGDLTLTEAGSFSLNAPVGGSLVVLQGGTFTIKIVAAAEADVIGVTDAP